MLRKSAMYNLKVAVGGGAAGPSAGLLSVDPHGPQGVTPRTPEILNSLMAMSHPLDPYGSNATSATPNATANVPGMRSPSAASGSSGAASGSPSRSPPSLQHTRSQLIKEGLKLTLQTKRRHTSATSHTSGASMSGGSGDEDDDVSVSGKRSKNDHLTPEDEERRRRRRERNKVAATKCRIKKRERTVNLVQESEILESQNYELKTQIQELETQRRRLVDMLSSHSSTCTRPGHVHDVRDVHDLHDVRDVHDLHDVHDVHQPQQQPHQQQPPPPAYDMYSPTTPCSAQLAQQAGPSAYGDVLMAQYGESTGVPDDEQLPSYFPVTKHEVVDEPLLAGLDDPLDVYGGYPGMTGVDPSHPGHPPYCRPSTLALDTPATTPGSTTPGSLDSPHHHQHHQHHHVGHMGAMGIAMSNGPLPGPGSSLGVSTGHYQHHAMHMMGSPLPLSPENVFGMDSGCMA